MVLKKIRIEPLIVLEGIDSEGHIATNEIYEPHLNMASIGEIFSVKGREPFVYEEILEYVGHDEDGYLATLTIYQNDNPTKKELIYFHY